MMNYLVVDFLEESACDVVSESWMVDPAHCRWPPLQSSKDIANAVRTHKVPDSSWPSFEVIVLYTGDDYEKARKKSKEAETHSDIQSSDETQLPSTPKRKKIANKRYVVTDSDEEDVPIRRSPRKDPVAASSRKKTATLPELPSLPSPPALQFRPPADKITPITHRSRSTPQSRSPALTTANSPNVSISPLQKQIMLILESIRADQKELLAEVKGTKCKVEALYAQLADDPENEKQGIDAELGLPVDSTEALDDLDLKLQEDKGLARKLVSFLSLVGGRRVDDAVRRIMGTCLTNQLAMKYNWMGRNQKKTFSKLALSNVILSAVQKMSKFRSASSSEVEDIQKAWLRFAADRDGGRSRRKSAGVE